MRRKRVPFQSLECRLCSEKAEGEELGRRALEHCLGHLRRNSHQCPRCSYRVASKNFIKHLNVHKKYCPSFLLVTRQMGERMGGH